MAESRLAVVLGGGAARGIAHVGVLAVLDELGVRPDLIVGTSIGALVGGLYACCGHAAEVRRRLEEFVAAGGYDAGPYRRFVQMDLREGDGFFSQVKKSVLKGLALGKVLVGKSIIPAEECDRALSALIPDVQIESLGLPFACVAADLLSGDEVLITGGNLRRAVQASCAIPGVYEPVPEGEMLLVDGGWVDKTPVPCARFLGADRVLAVSVARELRDEMDRNLAVDVILRSNILATCRLDRLQLAGADLVLEPRLDDVHWMGFDQVAPVIGRGEEVARSRADEIRLLARPPRWWRSLAGWKNSGSAVPGPIPPRVIRMGGG